MKTNLQTLTLSLLTLVLTATPALANWQDTYPGTMCNEYLGNVGPFGGVEIVNGTAGDILVDCPFKNDPGQTGPVCANTTQYLDFRGSMDCTLRATVQSGAGWTWSPSGIYFLSGYNEYFWNGNYNSSYLYMGSAFECIMHRNSALNNYRVWQC